MDRIETKIYEKILEFVAQTESLCTLFAMYDYDGNEFKVGIDRFIDEKCVYSLCFARSGEDLKLVSSICHPEKTSDKHIANRLTSIILDWVSKTRNRSNYKYLEKAEIKGKKFNKVWYGYSTTPENFAKESVEFVMSDGRDRNADISYSREVDGKIFTLKLDAGSERMKVYVLEDSREIDIGTISTNIGFSDEFIEWCVLFCVTDYRREPIEKGKPDYEQKYWDCQRQIDQYEREREEFKKEREYLKKALKEAEKNETRVPDNLRFQNGETCYSMATTGATIDGRYNDDDYTDHVSTLTRRLFKTREYAELFAEKTQFIADCLHFKYLYDRDYEPNWDSDDEQKFCVYYNHKTKKYDCSFRITYQVVGSVYFSTWELAKRCADWLNKEYN